MYKKDTLNFVISKDSFDEEYLKTVLQQIVNFINENAVNATSNDKDATLDITLVAEIED